MRVTRVLWILAGLCFILGGMTQACSAENDQYPRYVTNTTGPQSEKDDVDILDPAGDTLFDDFDALMKSNLDMVFSDDFSETEDIEEKRVQPAALADEIADDTSDEEPLIERNAEDLVKE